MYGLSFSHFTKRNTPHFYFVHLLTQEQVNAWTGESMDYEFWHQRLKSKLPFIAENHGEIVGFAELEANGHIDCFYCHSQYQRQGIGSKLLTHIENTAKSRGIKRLYAEVSITAKPFFQHWQFTIVREQEVERRGIKFKNYVMEKYL